MAFYFEWKPSERQLPEIDSNGVAIKNEDGSHKTYSVPPRFDGMVKVRIPSNAERIKFMKSTALIANQDGQVIETKGIDQTIAFAEFAKSHIEKVELKRLEDGYEFKTLEELDFDVDGLEVLTDIGVKLSQGIRLGKN